MGLTRKNGWEGGIWEPYCRPSDIFEEFGRVNNFEHKIAIDPEVKPVSQHIRRMPVSQIEAVNNELDRMKKSMSQVPGYPT